MNGWREGERGRSREREGERRATLVTKRLSQKKVVTTKRESDIVAKKKGGRVLLKSSIGLRASVLKCCRGV